jgi:hypothetical protein
MSDPVVTTTAEQKQALASELEKLKPRVDALQAQIRAIESRLAG